MIAFKIISCVLIVLLIYFLWMISIVVTTPDYEWEESVFDRRSSNIAILFIILLSFLFGYIVK